MVTPAFVRGCAVSASSSLTGAKTGSRVTSLLPLLAGLWILSLDYSKLVPTPRFFNSSPPSPLSPLQQRNSGLIESPLICRSSQKKKRQPCLRMDGHFVCSFGPLPNGSLSFGLAHPLAGCPLLLIRCLLP